MLPWYSSDWFASEAFAEMTLEAQAAYRNLLDRLWLSGACTLPDDDTRLRTLAGASTAEWKRVGAAVRMRLVPAGPGQVTNARLRHEWRKAMALRKVKRAMARQAAKTRWDQGLRRNREPSAPDAVRMRTECPPSPSPTPTPEERIPPLSPPARAGGRGREIEAKVDEAAQYSAKNGTPAYRPTRKRIRDWLKGGVPFEDVLARIDRGEHLSRPPL
jgi:uncharacterized protein YdaU (DUF1376 family)